MPQKPNSHNDKDDAYFEALNQRLMSAIVTLTGAFMLIGLLLYLFLGR